MTPIYRTFCMEYIQSRDCRAKIGVTLMATDLVLTISSVVLATLGLLSIIAIPAAASYALIGIGAAITFIWLITFIGFQIRNRCCNHYQFDLNTDPTNHPHTVPANIYRDPYQTYES